MSRCVDVPELRLLLDELLHQFLAFFTLYIYDLNTSLFQVCFAPKKGFVLSDYHARNSIEDTGPSTYEHNKRFEGVLVVG